LSRVKPEKVFQIYSFYVYTLRTMLCSFHLF